MKLRKLTVNSLVNEVQCSLLKLTIKSEMGIVVNEISKTEGKTSN